MVMLLNRHGRHACLCTETQTPALDPVHRGSRETETDRERERERETLEKKADIKEVLNLSVFAIHICGRSKK